MFWPKFLGSDVNFPPTIKKVVMVSLVIAISSSDVERSFSFLNLIEKTHTGIEEISLEALLRVKMNGPNELERFNGYLHAENFVYQEGNLKVDDPCLSKEK